MIAATKNNGIDTELIERLVADIRQDHRRGIATFAVTTTWRRGMRSDTQVNGWALGSKRIPHRFSIGIDEPAELCGEDSCPNPQEYLLAAMNACMLNTFIAACSLMGVTVETLVIESGGDLDLRGFLGIDQSVKAGYDSIRYTIRVKGDGTPEQFAKAHEAMRATSPNYFNLANAVVLRSDLVIDQ